MNIEAKSYNILLIEDDKHISSYLKSAFEARNHTIVVIDDGNNAKEHLKTINKPTYDIILLDLMLPGATGWEILVKIRSLSTLKNCPVIMLTAIDDSSSEARALYDGADDYVIKPFTFKVLMARIEANIRKKTNNIISEIELPFSDGNFEPLTDREKEILGYIVKGYNSKEIGNLIFISDQTVMNHVKNILKKLKVENRMQAAILALKYNLI
ncbi:MAG: response regulator transcription factor [Cyanobacteriota bacterium]